MLLPDRNGGFSPSLHVPADTARKGMGSAVRKPLTCPSFTALFSHREDLGGKREDGSLLPPSKQ